MRRERGRWIYGRGSWICVLLGMGCSEPDEASVQLNIFGQGEVLLSTDLPSTELGLGEEWIRLDFTRPGTDSGEGEDPELDDALVELIDGAEVSLDLALYDFDREVVIEAVLAAWDRGVDVRAVGDEDEADEPGFEAMEDAGIPVEYRPSSSRIMHHKFAVVDESVVWTGSTNLTHTGLEMNHNHALIFGDDDLAEAYTSEFEQMALDGAFGRSKDDVLSTHDFTVAGVELGLFFAPQDDPEEVVIDAIASADHSIRFMIFSFTHQDVAAALVEAAERGVDVVGIMDKSQASSRYAMDDELAMSGIPILIDGNENTSGWAGGKLHHKVMVIDAGTPSMPTVISGSMNWSGAGTSDNDENLVRLQNGELASAFASEFCGIFEAAVLHSAYVGVRPDPCTQLESPPTVELEDADIFVNEVLVLDENGERNGSFIELLHTSDEAVELEGASLVGIMGPLVEFGSLRVEAGQSVVLCGSVAPADLPCDVEVEGELLLEWGGEQLQILSADGELVEELFLPPAVPGTSLNRSPDGSGDAPLIRHDDLSSTGLSSSPGRRADGTEW